MKPVYAMAALIGAFALGMAVEWQMGHLTPTLDPPAPEVRQADRSLVLERKSDPAAKPAQQIPSGARVERIVQVVVSPSTVETPRTLGALPQAGANLPPAIPCPPVRVDLTLIRLPDQTRRVIASSPDGMVTGGLDVPVEAPPVQSVPKWALTGLVGYDFRQRCRVYGAMASGSAGPFSIQAGYIGSTAFVGAGVRF